RVENKGPLSVAQPAGSVVVRSIAGDQAVRVDGIGGVQRPVRAHRWIGVIDPGIEIDGGIVALPKRSPRTASGSGGAIGIPDDEPRAVDGGSIAVGPADGPQIPHHAAAVTERVLRGV